MKKLALNIEELEVESFDTDGEPRRRGTVEGREMSQEGSGCYTDDVCCGARTIGDACGTSGYCDDISVCWGTLC